jgi:hypothetical protein
MNCTIWSLKHVTLRLDLNSCSPKIETDKSSFFRNNSSFAIDNIISFMFKKNSLTTPHILMLI